MLIDRSRFQEYIEYFNAFDPRFAEEFYADDAVMELGPDNVRGRRAIFERFKELRNGIDEKIVSVDFFVSDATGVAALITGEFRATEDIDNPWFSPHTVKKGSVRRQRGVVLYGVENGKFTLIKAVPPEILNDWRLEDA